MENKSFEEKMLRLEQIIRTLEKGDAPLEASLNLFKEGTKLVADCGKILDKAELQVKKIVPGPDGAPTEEDFPNE